MEVNSKVKKIIVILVIALLAVTGIALAGTKINELARGSHKGDNSNIYFEADGNNPKSIDVYLDMADNSSVASFQVGLEVDVDENYDANFEWDLKEDENTTLLESRKSDSIDGDTTRKRINLYYSGLKELNDFGTDSIKLGTIKVAAQEGASKDTSITIQSIDENKFSKTVSLSHNSTEILKLANNEYSYRPIEVPSTGPSESAPPASDPTPSDGPEIGDPTASPSAEPSSEPSTAPSDEPSTEPSASPSDDPSQGSSDSPSSGDNNQNNQGGNSGSSSGASSSSNSDNNNSNHNIVDVVINGLKTGANKSVTWAVITLAVLVVVAIVLAKKKGKLAKRGRHGK